MKVTLTQSFSFSTGAILRQVAEDEFLIAGTSIVATFEGADSTFAANILSVEEGDFKKEKWNAGRRLNGDEDHQGMHIRIPYGDGQYKK